MLGAGLVVYGLGCSGAPAPLRPPSLSPAEAGEAAIAQYDANRDGAIAGDELAKAPGLLGAQSVLDKDNDGRVTAAEIAARLEQYIKDGVGLSAMPCQVRMDGRPLTEATVSLIPETFMGPNIKTAKGVTDSDGMCLLSTEAEEIDGVHCGIFRIEISKKDAAGKETVPPKYNTATTLGVDTGLQGLPEGGLDLRLTRN
jgi:hypothetical protein